MILACRRRGSSARPLCALIALGCGVLGPGVRAAEQGDEAALNSLRAEIVSLIGDAPCANLVHCRVLALGTRPCGGAAAYLAYSSLTGNKDLLESKAFEYGFVQEEAMRGKSANGTCEVTLQPRAMCIDGRCRLNTSPH